MTIKIQNGLDLAIQKIINLGDPTSAQDASTKAYSDLNISSHAIVTGEANTTREALTSSILTSGSVFIKYFTATKTETITNTNTYTTATGTGPTLCRVGVYTVAGNGDLTFLVGTTSDTTLWNAANAKFTKALSASWSKVKGTRYATAVIYVGTTSPTLVGGSYSATGGIYLALSTPPRVFGLVLSQSDLPSTITEASLVSGTLTNVRAPYIEFT
jgi:hypothetical protein